LLDLLSSLCIRLGTCRGPAVWMAVSGLFSYLVPFSSSLQLAWRGQWGLERLAECPDRDRALAGHTLAGMAERILAAGDGLGRSRQFSGYSAAAALPGEDSGLKGFSCGAYPRSFKNFED
jgi:hypothetical protein